MPTAAVTGFVFAGVLSGAAIAYVIGAAAILTFVLGGNAEYMAVLPQRLFSQLDVFAVEVGT